MNIQAQAPTIPQPADTDTHTHVWDEGQQKWVPVFKKASIEEIASNLTLASEFRRELNLTKEGSFNPRVGDKVYVRPIKEFGTIIRATDGLYKVDIGGTIYPAWLLELELAN